MTCKIHGTAPSELLLKAMHDRFQLGLTDEQHEETVAQLRELAQPFDNLWMWCFAMYEMIESLTCFVCGDVYGDTGAPECDVHIRVRFVLDRVRNSATSDDQAKWN